LAPRSAPKLMALISGIQHISHPGQNPRCWQEIKKVLQRAVPQYVVSALILFD